MLLATKLKRQIEKKAAEKNISVRIELKNIIVDGAKRGCSGHITDLSTGCCVYVTTEKSCYGPLAAQSMYRLAKNNQDYHSNSLKNGFNRWCNVDDTAKCIVDLLASGEMPVQNKGEYKNG